MKLRLLTVLLPGLLLAGGCQAVPPAGDTLDVVVGLYPYAYLAQAVGGSRVQVTNLTQPGAEPHDLELTARQVVSVAQADLVIYEAGLQPAVDSAVRQTTPRRVLDVTAVTPLQDEAGTRDLDPHIWLDPLRMVTVARAVADALSSADPGHAADYAAGLAGVTSTLSAIDAAYAAGLAACQRRAFITTHAAFGYLAERYGLTQVAIAGLSPDADPSPARIAEIHDVAVAQGLTTVFFETLASPALAETLATDLGLRTDQLDPIEGITAASRGSDYPALMATNLVALRTANGCS